LVARKTLWIRSVSRQLLGLENAAPGPVFQPIVIPINVVLHDPRPGFNNLVLLTGEVQCALTSALPADIGPAFSVVKVDQTVAIEVSPFSGPGGKISEKSSDNVTVPYGGSGLLQKACKVSFNSDPGLPQNLTLNMTFKVTGGTISISGVWLSTI